MPGWTWEYVEETCTADRMNALFNSEQKQQSKPTMTLEEFKAQFPNGISV